MAYGIGLDIGIASVGFASVALDERDEPCGILRMGVRIFDAAEHPKNGASLAAPRREARSMRRRLRRHRHRIERIRELMVSSGLLTEKELASLFEGELTDVYVLRAKALDEPLTQKELARVLLHLAQRRGFRSNRKADADDKETGRLLQAVSANAARMQEKGYRTVGEMFLKDEVFREHKRNKSENYLSTVTRAEVEKEARLILETQAALGNASLTEAFREKYLDILLSQRPFDLGPGGNSPYGGNQIEKMIGKCTFEPDELRAPKASYSFEYFQLLQKINHIRLVKAGESLPLSAGQRKQIVEFAHKSDGLTFDKIRKTLGIGPEYLFNAIYYKGAPEEAEKKTKLGCLKAYHEMRKALDKLAKGRIALIDTAKRNAAAYALSAYKSDEPIRAFLEAAGFEEADIGQLLCLKGFSGFGHLSTKACDKIIPFLEQGMAYNQACEAAGYCFRAHGEGERQTYLPAATEEMEAVTSPVVRRAVAQTIKVVNALIREEGESPSYVKIELAREMAKDFQERSRIEKENRENAAENERAMEYLRTELGVSSPTGQDLLKYRLYTEQDGRCLYSQKPIALSRLFEKGYAEIDHIVPYSISFDDRFTNKALVLAEENRKKGNRLPLEYLTGAAKDSFIVYVSANVKNGRKRQNLLREHLTEDDRSRFRERNLQDTKTMSVFLYNYINDHLLFAPSKAGRKKRVTAVNGAITSYLRKRWGISKIREDGDLHHATDALVIACTTDGMIRRISRYAELREGEYVQTEDGSHLVDTQTGELLEKFPYPWPHFRKEWEARLNEDPATVLKALALKDYRGRALDDPRLKPIFVSRMPKHKVTGAAHKETYRSAKLAGEGLTLSKVELTKLKLKDGEIPGYYAPESDRLLYEALKQRLAAFGGNGEKAFAEPFYKPKADGTPGPLVKKVKLYEPSSLNVPVLGGNGIADNDSMVRIDVFYVEDDGYYFVPIYVADTVKKELPDRAVVGGKPASQWKKMNEADFIFSVYPSDLLYIEHAGSIKLSVMNENSTLAKEQLCKKGLFYYVKGTISTGAIVVTNHDRTYYAKALGIKTLQKLEKYQVDVLGNFHKVEKEPRLRFR